MTMVFDSHRRIRSGEVSPKLSKKGPPVVLEVYSVEDAKTSPSVQGELVANCDTLDFRSRIYTVRGVQVMLDRDLASAYHVSTTAFNQAVKRNLSRFPEGFRFQLTKDEHSVLMSQIVISKRELGQETRGGYHKLPYAFTEQGIAMLSGILRSDVAIAVSIRLMNTFVEMRRALASMAPMQSRLEAIERRQISDQNRNEERFDQIFAKMSEGDMPLAQIFYQGKFWDAKSLLIKFIRRAKNELIVIDAYPGVATLDMLAKRGRGVKVELVTHSNGELAESDFEAFARQCGNFTKTICGICHDRFIIASTATVRMADEQIRRVFYRKCSVFPPSGIDVEDNFFAVQRPIRERSGRDYIGICALGMSRPAALIRTYVAFLTAGQTLLNSFGRLADPYMTAVGYFNSLRELGGMRRLSEDDVQTRSYRVTMDSRVARPGLTQRRVTMIDELTSRVSSRDIPQKLAQLEVEFKRKWNKGDARAIDIVLATNMLSVGVDIDRLGLMIANGQPKNTAEYIQATSRVGRKYPGIVCTVFAWSRPRDFSHYEMFEHYHATFYKQVEAQSVTPFAPRALDRGLTGAMISEMRLNSPELAPNTGAGDMKSAADSRVAHVRDIFVKRAKNVMLSNDSGDDMSEEIMERIDHWVSEATQPGRTLGYERKSRQGEVVPLLERPGLKRWDINTVPTSMREVESSVCLIMDKRKLSPAELKCAPWVHQKED